MSILFLQAFLAEGIQFIKVFLHLHGPRYLDIMLLPRFLDHLLLFGLHELPDPALLHQHNLVLLIPETLPEYYVLVLPLIIKRLLLTSLYLQ